MPQPQTFVDWTEEMIDSVVQSLADDVDMLMDTLAPDGRPYGQEPMGEREKLQKYEAEYRGNPDAWSNLIRTQVAALNERLQSRGLPQDKILSGHLYNAVIAQAVKYSAGMERKIQKRDEVPASAMSGLPIPPEEVEDGGPGQPA